jgi:hypothetical protein
MKGGNAPNIKTLVNNFNKFGNWVWNEILSIKELKERVAMVTKLIGIAKVMPWVLPELIVSIVLQ